MGIASDVRRHRPCQTTRELPAVTAHFVSWQNSIALAHSTPRCAPERARPTAPSVHVAAHMRMTLQSVEHKCCSQQAGQELQLADHVACYMTRLYAANECVVRPLQWLVMLREITCSPCVCNAKDRLALEQIGACTVGLHGFLCLRALVCELILSVRVYSARVVA